MNFSVVAAFAIVSLNLCCWGSTISRNEETEVPKVPEGLQTRQGRVFPLALLIPLAAGTMFGIPTSAMATSVLLDQKARRESYEELRQQRINNKTESRSYTTA